MDLSAIINSVQDALNLSPITCRPTSEDKRKFQETLSNILSKNLFSVQTCEIEFSLSRIMDEVFDGYEDKCDVFVETKHCIVIVELDATRADQVAKKMLSRYFYAEKQPKPTIYVCLLYPGTKNMNVNECIKYMNMGKDILLNMNSSNRFIGGLIDGNKLDWKYIG
jgi:hypothetical protein